MATEWRLFRGWSSDELRSRLDASASAARNFEADEAMMTAEEGWHHYHSDAVIAREPEGSVFFERAAIAVANYRFSSPHIVTAHFDPSGELLGRTILLEIRVLGLRYLCPARVARVREEAGVFGFRYDTLEGHIERGMEWFLLTKAENGDIRFRIEARWRAGEFPNWWSRAGFAMLAGYYQRRWHRLAHRRLARLAHFGSPAPPPRDARGLAHQGVDVTFTYHSRRRK